MVDRVITHLLRGGTLVMTTGGRFYMSNKELTSAVFCTNAGRFMLDAFLIDNGPPINQFSREMVLTDAGREYLTGRADAKEHDNG